MKHEIDPTNYREWLLTTQAFRNLVFQSLDLSKEDEYLASLEHATSTEDNCIFLGCILGPKLAQKAASHHALIFPKMDIDHFEPFRHSLYSVEELFEGFDPNDPSSYFETTDWKIYRTFIKIDANNQPFHPTRYVEAGIDELLARRLHDHFVEGALEGFLRWFRKNAGNGIVAIMGGHDEKRSSKQYREIACLARQLTLDGCLVATGGGPGLMEAANLGAFFAGQSKEALTSAIAQMAKLADLYSDRQWLASSWNVRSRVMAGDFTTGTSLGVPTWFYGHEPPNVFATQMAKYFENSLREEGLLAIATHGVVFAEGNAGTVQEIFQDACQNYYTTYEHRSPMILFGSEYWSPMATGMCEGRPTYSEGTLPSWPLLQGLAQRKKFREMVHLTSDTNEVLSILRAFKPS